MRLGWRAHTGHAGTGYAQENIRLGPTQAILVSILSAGLPMTASARVMSLREHLPLDCRFRQALAESGRGPIPPGSLPDSVAGRVCAMSTRLGPTAPRARSHDLSVWFHWERHAGTKRTLFFGRSACGDGFLDERVW